MRPSFLLTCLTTIGIGVTITTSMSPAAGTPIRWKLLKDMSINLVKQGDISVYRNEALVETKRENNIINLLVKKAQSPAPVLEGRFKTFTYYKNGILKLENSFSSRFKMTPQGKYSVPADQIQPTIRSIPTFPAGGLQPGDSWQAECAYFYYQFDPTFLLVTNAHYTYLSNGQLSDTRVAVITIEYQFAEDVKKQLGTSKPHQVAYVLAHNVSRLYWDLSRGLPLKQRDNFREAITFNNGDTWRWNMQFTTEYDVTFPLKKEELKSIQKEIDQSLGGDLKKAPVESYIDERGCTLV